MHDIIYETAKKSDFKSDNNLTLKVGWCNLLFPYPAGVGTVTCKVKKTQQAPSETLYVPVVLQTLLLTINLWVNARKRQSGENRMVRVRKVFVDHPVFLLHVPRQRHAMNLKGCSQK